MLYAGRCAYPVSPLHPFSRAVDLAEKHNFPQMEALLVRHTGQLLQKGDPLQAVEVFRMAGKATDAALLLAKLAEDAGKIFMFRPPPQGHGSLERACLCSHVAHRMAIIVTCRVYL